ncbi:mitogen-activated protein kinase kinase kinase A-like isoform X2 [Paramacrobiotus metropolitanus]|uniref:mitogen-activated protein kinase kinase kinase A-like isoform X2 n=1 Tax=Paramacrobiotus metropolitanus TaxID=2943436 RepID=UPI002445A1D2|nr:mitogen-activated protein kinase kinase kinase A-like isoform X2 [Paramacrobiotus metropolitanus]
MDPFDSKSLGSNCQYYYDHTCYLARGTFGVVYRARITERGDFAAEDHHVAVKVSHLDSEPELFGGVNSWFSLMRRWEKMLAFKHDHLVNYHKVSIFRGIGAPAIEFMMDFCNGGDLVSLLKKHKKDGPVLHPSTVICYGAQISEGVRFLDQNHIIHGDLKPGNVLVKYRNNHHHQMMIGDLDDLVQMQRTVTTSSDIEHLRGTIMYMSPEMLRKFSLVTEDVPGRKTDIWSLGCITHDLADECYGIAERVLHNTATVVPDYVSLSQHTSASMIAGKIIDGYVPLVSDKVPLVFSGVIQKCFVIESKERPSAGVLKSMLFEAATQLVSTHSAEITGIPENCKFRHSFLLHTTSTDAILPTIHHEMSELSFFPTNSAFDNSAVQNSLQDPGAVKLSSPPVVTVRRAHSDRGRSFVSHCVDKLKSSAHSDHPVSQHTVLSSQVLSSQLGAFSYTVVVDL